MPVGDLLSLTGLPGSSRARALLLKGSLELERTSFLEHWRTLGDYFYPRRMRFWPGDRNRGDKRNQKIKDSSPRFAVRTMMSGLHAGLTNPARPWLRLSTADPALAKFKPVKTYLQDVADRMLAVFAQANLYQVLPSVYGDEGVFGTASMGIMEDEQDVFRAWSYPIGSYAIGLDARGRAAVFMREFELSVYQVVETYGLLPDGRTIDWSRISPGIRNLWDRSQYQEPVEICWLVYPNPDFDPNRNMGPRSFKWRSVHFETGGRGGVANGVQGFGANYELFLKESGYREFPILAPRWETTGEDCYGTDCPGMSALPDVLQLNSEAMKKGQAIEKHLNPPMAAPPQLKSTKVSLIPGDVTYVNDTTGKQLRPIHEMTLGLNELREDIADLRFIVSRHFYEDLFLMISRSDSVLGAARPTAREIDERKEEKLIALGPMLERTNDELLDPLVDRTFAMMQRRGMLPEAPPELQGQRLRIEYINYLQQAQRMLGVALVDRFMTTAVNLAATWPEVKAKIRPFKAIDEYADRLGVHPDLVNSDEEAEEILNQAAQAEAAAAQQAQIPQMAGAIKDLSEAPVEGTGTGDTALKRLVEQAQGAA